MTPTEKARRVIDLNRTIETMALARIWKQYGPNLSEREERLRLASLYLPRETMIEVFDWDPDVHGRWGPRPDMLATEVFRVCLEVAAVFEDLGVP